jgi:hypothetical protein
VDGANPSGANLERLAEVLQLRMARHRPGEMKLPSHWHDVPAVDAELVENPFERRLLKAWRALPAKPRILFLELVKAYQGRKSR